MKFSKVFQNISGILIISSLLLMPFSTLTKVANAQAVTAGNNTSVGNPNASVGNPNSSVTSGAMGGFGGSASAYVSMITPAIKQLPGCKKVLEKQGNKIKNLFKVGLGDKANTSDSLSSSGSSGNLEEIRKELTNESEGVLVNTKVLEKKVDASTALLKKVDVSTSAVDDNQNCYNAIGKMVIKILVQKMTTSTIDWINGGYNGAPLFVTDPGKFLGDIAKSEILVFGSEISDSVSYPFGKAFLQNTAIQFNNKFQDNARYSLNEMIQQTTPEYSATEFKGDFSAGGWGAWDAMIQVPANNPIGFNMMASTELSKRLEGTQQSTAMQVQSALQQGSGFLGDQRCTEPWGVTKEEDDFAKKIMTNNDRVLGDTSLTGGPQKLASDQYQGHTARVCKKWEYVTPGSVISHTLTKSMDNNSNSLLSAETLNDAIAAILDAAMAKFSSDLTQKGLAYMDRDVNTDIYSNMYDGSFYSKSQTELDFANPSASTWLVQNPDFNIRTDLNQALIDEQKIFIEKLRSQNKEISSTTDGKRYNPKGKSYAISNAYGLIPSIYQLDFCIPGPHPGFEYDAQERLATIMAAVPTPDKDAKEKFSGTGIVAGASIGAAVGAPFAGIGAPIGAVVGAVVGTAIELGKIWFTQMSMHNYWGGVIGFMTGIQVTEEKKVQDADVKEGRLIMTKEQANSILNTILGRYSEIISHVFNPSIMPSVTAEAKNEFEKIDGLKAMIIDNDTKIAASRRVVTNLEGFKTKIDALNTDLASSKINQDQYEASMVEIIAGFERLSSQMASGDDIASVDNVLKEIIDEKNYVYNDLLKGPFGCEKELENNTTGMSWYLQQTRRMTYPAEILYNYNVIAPGNAIPDPFLSGFNNKTNISASITSSGPGFLSSVFFGKGGQDCSADQKDAGANGSIENKLPPNLKDDWKTHCALNLHDILTTQTSSANVSIGANPYNTNYNFHGMFETIFGIY